MGLMGLIYGTSFPLNVVKERRNLRISCNLLSFDGYQRGVVDIYVEDVVPEALRKEFKG